MFATSTENALRALREVTSDIVLEDPEQRMIHYAELARACVRRVDEDPELTPRAIAEPLFQVLRREGFGDAAAVLLDELDQRAKESAIRSREADAPIFCALAARLRREAGRD